MTGSSFPLFKYNLLFVSGGFCFIYLHDYFEKNPLHLTNKILLCKKAPEIEFFFEEQ